MPRSTRIVTPSNTDTKPVNVNSHDIEPLYTEAETAEILRTTRLTLRKWRIKGTGPRHTKMGVKVLYRASEIEKYIEERTSSGSDRESERDRNKNEKDTK